MKINSLRLRFSIWVAVMLLVVLGAFGTYVYFTMSRGLFLAFDDALALNASQVIAGLEINNNQLFLPENLTESPEKSDPHLQATIRILSPDGKTLQTSGSVFLPLPDLESIPSFTTWTDPGGGQTMRIYSAPVSDNGYLLAVVQIARSAQLEQDTLQRLLTTLLLGSPILVLLAATGGYFLAARALAPIGVITRTARRISATDLSARLNLPHNDDEVGRLAATFDDMLARLDDSFHRERQFTADASHELRTPLAAMQAILSVIRERRRSPKEYEQALDDLAEETARLSGLTKDLLLLARGEIQADLHPQLVALSDLLNDLAESLRPLAEAKNLTLDAHIPDKLSLSGNSDNLIRLFVNLLDNAIKYTEHGGISLAARAERHSVVIEVKDTGLGILPEHLPHIFDRFYRVEASRTHPGSGLGLAIAREIARAHGGDIQVDSDYGKGATFTVRLPAL
ncbi:MAG: ATP-binding protein [Coprothermobacterota bacterium]|nr:ATP-binding protein [Coprothermobacterota bacterium]